MNISDLRLSEPELDTLWTIRNCTATIDHPERGESTTEWIEILAANHREALDMLVLCGLAERRADGSTDPFGPRGWRDEWRLTEAGIEVAEVLDRSFDWREQAYKPNNHS
jgi:hypothetical protein